MDEDEGFSVCSNDHLIYSRQLIGIKFAFSWNWKREKYCWICEKRKLCILIQEVNCEY